MRAAAAVLGVVLLLASEAAAAPGPRTTLRNLPPDEDWFEPARLALLDLWDADESGRIDTSAEVVAIPCGAWRALDAAYRRLDKHGMWGLRVAFGFVRRRPEDAYRYIGDWTLGIDASVQVAADEAMAVCGVRR